MTASILTRRFAAAALGAVVLMLPSTLSAQRAQRTPTQSEMPPWNEIARVSPSGSYLAARHASVQRDAAAASAYYRAALKADPRNSELLERAFLSVVADGDMDEAIRLAERLVAVDRNHRLARLVLGVRALKQKQYATARTNSRSRCAGRSPISPARCSRRWAQYGASDSKGAIEAIDKLQGADWYALFKDLHAGMMLDLAGNRRKPASVSSAPTSSTTRRCGWSRPMAPGCRATAAGTRRSRSSSRSTASCRAIR